MENCYCSTRFKTGEDLDMALRKAMQCGVYVGSGEMPAGYNVQIDPNGEAIVGHTAAECQEAFLRYAHKKLRNYGITTSTFVDPSGYIEGSITTPADLLRIGLIAAANSKSIKYWGGTNNDVTINIMGKNPREETMEESWKNVGGTRYVNKGGSTGTSTNQYRSLFQITTVNKQHVAMAIMAKGSHCAKMTTFVSQVKTMLTNLQAGDTVAEPTELAAMVSAGGGYTACFLPHDIAMYQQIDYDKLMRILNENVKNNDKVQLPPSSTTKIVTLICALDALGSELDTVEVTEDDILGGSGIDLFAGDRLTIGDALFALMMSSSNTIATTLARYIGDKVLKSEGA